MTSGQCSLAPSKTGAKVRRNAFFSFHYVPDNWRAATVRGIGALDGNEPVSDNRWEEVTNGGDAAIERWISNEMRGRTCAVVLAGSGTANRRWINYEISKAWNDNLGVVAIHIHGLKDRDQRQSAMGKNPLDYVKFTSSGMSLSSVAKCYNPPYTDSRSVYRYISDNISDWVEEAIRIRRAN
ncbi:TIR domain-containing protein [Saccharomonospora azurea]|uniref:TIR domain-containing protein n=1 Tax=Saccharomonospora azurea TaxID=40988 RepID=UPI00333076C9